MNACSEIQYVHPCGSRDDDHVSVLTKTYCNVIRAEKRETREYKQVCGYAYNLWSRRT